MQAPSRGKFQYTLLHRGYKLLHSIRPTDGWWACGMGTENGIAVMRSQQRGKQTT
jgi:hypothetical protein